MLNFSEKEQQDYEKFWNKHFKKCRTNNLNINIQYNGIGSTSVVSCPKCGKEQDITDIGVW